MKAGRNSARDLCLNSNVYLIHFVSLQQRGEAERAKERKRGRGRIGNARNIFSKRIISICFKLSLRAGKLQKNMHTAYVHTCGDRRGPISYPLDSFRMDERGTAWAAVLRAWN